MFTRISETSTYLLQLRLLQKTMPIYSTPEMCKPQRVRQAALASHVPELPHSHLCLP